MRFISLNLVCTKDFRGYFKMLQKIIYILRVLWLSVFSYFVIMLMLVFLTKNG